MQRNQFPLGVALLGAIVLACGGDPKITSATITPTTIAAGGTVTMTVVLENTTLVEEAPEGLTAKGLRAANVEAHLHVYLDNTDVNPLVQTASTSFPVLIPRDTTAGMHTLISRLQHDDHTIIMPEVKATTALTVTTP